ncbi:type II secretion system pilot lipoprotein GspS-beta [Vibrio metschnikovii]
MPLNRISVCQRFELPIEQGPLTIDVHAAPRGPMVEMMMIYNNDHRAVRDPN